MSDVTILGAGPAGLLAALAARQSGANVEIIADGDPSPIGGAQYLHAPIPGLTDGVKPEMLTYVKVGDMDGYARKAYGEAEAQVSWETFVTGEYPAWSLRDWYQKLWEMFESQIVTFHLEPRDIDRICKRNPNELVFSSIPLKAICKDPIAHDFQGQEVIFTEEDYVKVPNMIVYNGRQSDQWYRSACLFGYCSTEYTKEHAPAWALTNGNRPVRYRGIKPTVNFCNCYKQYPNFIKIGRFGQWRRGILTDHAYEEVKDRL